MYKSLLYVSESRGIRWGIVLQNRAHLFHFNIPTLYIQFPS